MAMLTIELTKSQEERLQAAAQQLGVEATELARAALVDALSLPSEAFKEAVKRVLGKNLERYRRLA